MPQGEVVMFKARMKPPNSEVTRMVQGTLFMTAFLNRGWIIVEDPMNRLPHGYAQPTYAETTESPKEAESQSVPPKGKRGRKGRRSHEG